MGRHDRANAGRDRSAEGLEGAGVERVDERQREMRVDGRVAVAGKVLRAGGDAGALEPSHEGGNVPRDELGVRAERADADDRVLRVRVDVRDRREVEVDAGVRQLGAQRRRDALAQLDVVDDPERCVPRIRAAGRRLEPCHVAALLVDRDDEVLALRAQLGGQRAQLLAALDVPRVEDDAAEAVREAPSHPVGHGRALEAGKDAARRESLEVGHQALTAPAVRPNAILRCTSRKKMTTGIAVSVEAAMSPPQSVARLVP